MKKIYLSLCAASMAMASQAQIEFDPKIDPAFITDVVVVPGSPLKMQILFIGGVSEVETNETYGNAAGTYPAKEWHDFIGFTPDNTGSSLGWITVNHEMIVADDHIGDGGGMTSFRITRDETTDSLIVMDQTLTDGRSGKFFAIDFVNTVGETGMNCGGIASVVDGRIWTAEEWFQSSNSDIADRDTSDFIIGTGTVNGQVSPAGFPGFDGDTIQKYQNLNWMVEVDPREAVAIRKQYNWGRQGFEGGCVMPDNKTVFTGEDGTPGWLTKFVADTPGDFTQGKTYVYKHTANPKWVEIDNTDIDNMLHFKDQAVAAGATMFNRLEWVTLDTMTGMVYITETGSDNPGNAWAGELNDGCVFAPHHVSRASSQSTTADNATYTDYYGRVLQLDPTTDAVTVLVEGGPDLANGTSISNYPSVHLASPDGLGMLYMREKSYLVIEEDLNGTSYGRMPAGVTNRTCEVYLLDLSISNPTTEDLVRIAVVPLGAEVTGAMQTSDKKSLLINSQHPSTSNPYPYNHSLTFALTGWDQIPASVFEKPSFSDDAFSIYPNPTSRMVYFNEVQDVAIYNGLGQRIQVARGIQSLDISNLSKGTYFIVNGEGHSKKVVVE